MAGSMTWRTYTADDGTQYSVKTDESNANATAVANGGTESAAFLPVRTANLPPIPKSLKKRYVNAFLVANVFVKRRFYVSGTAFQVASQYGAVITTSAYPTGDGQAPGVSGTWIVTSVVGEKSKKPPAFNAPDTGLTDGTVSQ
jgi:hypothetical protein